MNNENINNSIQNYNSENITKKKGRKIFVIFLVIILIGLAFGGGYLLANKLEEKEGSSSVEKKEAKPVTNCVPEEEAQIETKPEEEQKEEEPQKEPEKSEEPEEEPQKEETPSNTKELTKTIQKVYESAYDELYKQFESDGSKTEKIDFYGKKYEMTPIDVTNLKKYFTTKELQNLLEKYSNYEKNGKYYYGIPDETWPPELESMGYFDPGTIFSATDAGERTLEIRAYSNDYILAQGKEVNGEYGTIGGEFIAFKKENGSWKIDMFE